MVDDTAYRGTKRETGGVFPSLRDQTVLRQRLHDLGYSNLATEDKWHHHAYDYAFRRRVLNDWQESSPIDIQGLWFNLGLAESATEYYRVRGLGKSG